MCAFSVDCPDPATACSGGSCTPNGCVTPYGRCGVSAPTANDGLCLPYDLGQELYFCTLGGTLAVGAPCEGPDNAEGGETSFALPTSNNCANGLVCDPFSLTCATACDPSNPGGASCSAGTLCTSTDCSYGDIGDCE